jgi:hypothetical protein
MMNPSSKVCSHDRRPATTVCLYCLKEERAIARQARNRLIARVGMATMGGAVIVALVVGGIVALAPEMRSRSIDESVTRSVTRDNPSITLAAKPEVPKHGPVIAIGRKDLGDGLVAERVGDQVTVHFDTETLRTRFDWKFEGIVRGTLPLMFGESARTALAAVPHGEFVRGPLLTVLPQRGLKLALPDSGGTLMVWPVVRSGRDGPLVVAYRASITK